MRLLDELERHVSSWAEVSAHSHRFGGCEFRFRAAEIGHVHTGGNCISVLGSKLCSRPSFRNPQNELLPRPYLHAGRKSKRNLVTREGSK
jgi:Family of unknown function (DUF5519)